MFKMTEEFTRGLFENTGFKVIRILELGDRYDPVRGWNWWLVKTEYGYIMIGPRHRVIAIDWEDTDLRSLITEDDVTKDNTFVHAWDLKKVVEYLQNLQSKLLTTVIDLPKEDV